MSRHVVHSAKLLPQRVLDGVMDDTHGIRSKYNAGMRTGFDILGRVAPGLCHVAHPNKRRTTHIVNKPTGQDTPPSTHIERPIPGECTVYPQARMWDLLARLKGMGTRIDEVWSEILPTLVGRRDIATTTVCNTHS